MTSSTISSKLVATSGPHSSRIFFWFARSTFSRVCEITDRKAEMRLKRINYELENQVSQKLFTKKMVQIGTNEISKMSKKILERKIDPLTAVEEIIRE